MVVVVCGGMGLGAVGQPAAGSGKAVTLAVERKVVHATACMYNLHEIGKGILLYSLEHKGNFPPDLGALVAEGHADLSSVVCPASDGNLPAGWEKMGPKEKGQWVNAHTDYVYVGAKRNQATAGRDVVLVYERDDNGHPNGLMNVLFGDGHVELLKVEALRKAVGAKAGTERATTRVKGPAVAVVAPPGREMTMDQSKSLYARMDLSRIGVALGSFELDKGRFPTAEEGLNVLAAKPGGYLEGIPKDPWGRAYRYVAPKKEGERPVVTSDGADGKAGTGDDVEVK
jgi:general secretion pathway protein G